MKLNRLETHDRLIHLYKDQALNISQGAEDCLKKNALSVALQERSPYIYIFAHPRTHDNGVTKRMIWQPRLTKPIPDTNSYCFRAISKTDNMEICWMIPPREQWGQYKKGNVTEHEIVQWSIQQYEHNRAFLGKKEPDDLDDETIRKIYTIVYTELKQDEMRDRLYKPMQDFLEV